MAPEARENQKLLSNGHYFKMLVIDATPYE